MCARTQPSDSLAKSSVPVCTKDAGRKKKKKHTGPFQAMLGHLKTNVAKVSTIYVKPYTLGEGVRRTESP